MSAARTERLLNLLTLLLNTRRPISLREIREMDEFSAYATDDPKTGLRAFERDKAALVELGVPLRWVAAESDDDEESGGGYVVDRERYYLPELRLSPSELALLSIAGAAAAAIEAFPGRAAVVRALAKLGFDSDDVTAHAPYLAHAPVNPGTDAERLGTLLDTLHDAVARRRRVRVFYCNAHGETSERELDPYGMYYRRGAWYLIGFCHLRGAERTFHLGRVMAVRPTGQGNDFEVPASFDLGAHVQQRPWEFPNEPPIEVVIRVAPRLVPAIPEIFGSRAIVEKDGAATRVHLSVSHRDALIAAVLPFGAAAEVVAPPMLRAEIGAMYRALARRYAESGRAAPEVL